MSGFLAACILVRTSSGSVSAILETCQFSSSNGVEPYKNSLIEVGLDPFLFEAFFLSLCKLEYVAIHGVLEQRRERRQLVDCSNLDGVTSIAGSIGEGGGTYENDSYFGSHFEDFGGEIGLGIELGEMRVN